MLSSGMLHCAALETTNDTEEHIASIIRVTTIGELGTLAVTSNQSMLLRNTVSLVTLMMEAIHSSETLVLTRATCCDIPENGILHSHCNENLKFYISSVCSACFCVCEHMHMYRSTNVYQTFSILHTACSLLYKIYVQHFIFHGIFPYGGKIFLPTKLHCVTIVEDDISILLIAVRTSNLKEWN
jgi:hypothetical protein